MQRAVGFEMSLILRRETREGWFGGDWAMADWYATIGLSADVQDHAQLSDVSQITGADVLWTNKKALKEWIEARGQTVGQLMERSGELRRAYDEGCMETRVKFPHGDFWLTLSPALDEMPVNLVVPRKVLEALPKSAHFVITDKGVKREGV